MPIADCETGNQRKEAGSFWNGNELEDLKGLGIQGIKAEPIQQKFSLESWVPEILESFISLGGVDHIDGRGIFFAHGPEGMRDAGIKIEAVPRPQRIGLVLVVKFQLPV